MTSRTITFDKSILLLTSLTLIAALVACGGSSHNSGGGGGGTTTPAISLTAAPSSLTAGATLSLTATITNDTSGANWSVSCSSTASGACGTFSAANTASGVAVTYTAPSTPPPAPSTVTITATVADNSAIKASTSAITISAVTVASSTYVFYASGEDGFGGTTVNYYAIAGAVTIDANGNILGGEQDYNDAAGLTATDTISPGSAALTVDSSTGQGVLTITTTDTNLGGVNTAPGVEQFAIQFANPNHALITQFDGFATSSGSLDLQTSTAAANGSYAFTAVGVDNNAPNSSYSSFGVGGVVTVSGTALTGVFDVNNANTAIVSSGNPITAAVIGPTDTYGRGTMTNTGIIASSSTFAYYVVGPATGSQALRIIDIDANDVAIGSAFGQGTATFTNASLPMTGEVFNLLGQWSESYATLGEFFTDANGNITAGEADDNELDNGVQQTNVSIAGGTYNVAATAANGYGTISFPGDGDVTATLPAGIYMVDPALNINDPNNTTSADVGGALLLDLDAGLPGGSGVITPITDQAQASFNGTYVAGFQNFNTFSGCGYCEFDMISQGTMVASAALSLTGDDSDPFGTWDGTPAESTGDTFTSTPLNVVAGVYSMSSLNSPTNQLDATINTAAGSVDADIYQASGTTLYWLEFDADGVFLGPIVAQGSLTGIPSAKQPAGKTQPRRDSSRNPIKGFGGAIH